MGAIGKIAKALQKKLDIYEPLALEIEKYILDCKPKELTGYGVFNEWESNMEGDCNQKVIKGV